jgi:hypothetical protein
LQDRASLWRGQLPNPLHAIIPIYGKLEKMAAHHSFTFQPNLADELHCLQASLGMTIEGMTGEVVPMDLLEHETAFRPGCESWAFGAMLALARRGLKVRSIENFDPHLFVRDPRAAMLSQVGDAALVDRAFEVSDVDGQLDLVRACIDSPSVTFDTRIPTLHDLDNALAAGAMVIVNVNAKSLNGDAGYSGHLVVVHDIQDGKYVVEDPGPPAKERFAVAPQDFERSWKTPSPGLANLMIVSAVGD